MYSSVWKFHGCWRLASRRLPFFLLLFGVSVNHKLFALSLLIVWFVGRIDKETHSDKTRNQLLWTYMCNVYVCMRLINKVNKINCHFSNYNIYIWNYRVGRVCLSFSICRKKSHHQPIRVFHIRKRAAENCYHFQLYCFRFLLFLAVIHQTLVTIRIQNKYKFESIASRSKLEEKAGKEKKTFLKIEEQVFNYIQ